MKKGSASSEAELPVKAQRRRDRGGTNSSSTSSADSYGRDYTPFKRWVAWLVPLFTAVNVIIFIITMYVNDCPKHTGSVCIAPFLGRFSFQPMKENPLLGPSSITLQKMGASEVSEVVKNRQVWRLFTCIWLHAGVFHLLANMLSLLFIGIRLEQEFGFVRIGMLYILSGFGGSLLSALFIQSSISVGASGALFGLLGSMLSELITNWTIYANKLAALLTLIVVITINLAFGILPHVDNFAHIGGFLSGFLLGFVFLIRPQFGWLSQRNAPPGYVSTSYKPKHKPYQHILWIVSLLLLIVGYVVGLVVLFKEVNANEYCHWCHYLSCIPTSKWKCNNTQVFCQASQTGDQLSLECVNSGKMGNYTLMDDNPSTIKRLCYELCS